MGKKKAKSAILSALRDACANEGKAVAFLEHQRWGDSPFCPRCGIVGEVYQMTDRETKERNKDYRWRCKSCKKMYSVRTGTIFEESRLPLRVWVYAFWKACSSKKGISALQLCREMEITHKSALFVLRRIRHGLGDQPGPMLSGTVEVDETYHGGKPRYRGQIKKGRRTRKTPVIGMLERGGRLRLQVMKRVTAKGLRSAIAKYVVRSARLMTDDFNLYRTAGREFKGGHFTVNHSARQYVKPGTDIHSNSIEGAFSLFKRGVMGTWHSISTKHLPNYLNEFEFRHNTRWDDDGERTAKAIRAADGKRLTYRDSVDRPQSA
ncbi:MAG: IS1595 family transposase [Planctomycetota bacterium]|nr:IS1595 family transposase [Planctomycetota bacterium]